MAAKFSSSAAARDGTGSRSDARLLKHRTAGLRSGDFDAVYRQGARRPAPHFLVLARPNGRGRSRFGISVRTALGTAVVRNRIKRRVRAILRQATGRLPPGWDVVVEPRTREVARAEFAQLEAELTQLLAAVAHP